MRDDLGQRGVEHGSEVRNQAEEGAGGGMVQVLDVQAQRG